MDKPKEFWIDEFPYIFDRHLQKFEAYSVQQHDQQIHAIEKYAYDFLRFELLEARRVLEKLAKFEIIQTPPTRTLDFTEMQIFARQALSRIDGVLKKGEK